MPNRIWTQCDLASFWWLFHVSSPYLVTYVHIITAHPFASGDNFICDKAKKDQVDESFLPLCSQKSLKASSYLSLYTRSCLSKVPRKSLTKQNRLCFFFALPSFAHCSHDHFIYLPLKKDKDAVLQREFLKLFLAHDEFKQKGVDTIRMFCRYVCTCTCTYVLCMYITMFFFSAAHQNKININIILAKARFSTHRSF